MSETRSDRFRAYMEWIAANVSEPYGACAQATQEMLAAFPELKRVRGHYVCVSGEYTHWWLETAGGEVIDPTASQFPPGGWYVAHPDGTEEPVGKCANCGGYIYESSGYTSTVCSDTCADSYARYVVSGVL